MMRRTIRVLTILVAVLPFFLMASTASCQEGGWFSPKKLVVPVGLHFGGNYLDYKSSVDAFALGAVETNPRVKSFGVAKSKVLVAVGGTTLDLTLQKMERGAKVAGKKKTRVALGTLKWVARAGSAVLYYRTWDGNRKVIGQLR